MSGFKNGDRVLRAGSNSPIGIIAAVSSRRNRTYVNWPGKVGSAFEVATQLVHVTDEALVDNSESIGNGNNRSTEPAPFRKGDRVENVNNEPGFIMTVAADQYTSGAVLVEWPTGNRHTEQAKHLKHAATVEVKAGDLIGHFGGHLHFENVPNEDVVTAPSHYRAHPSGIEVIDITRHESFLRGNVVKYVLRAPYKNNELEDMRKAAVYLAWEIERLEGEQP